MLNNINANFQLSIVNFHQIAYDVVRCENALFCKAKMPFFDAQKVAQKVRLGHFETVFAVFLREFVKGDSVGSPESGHDKLIVERVVVQFLRFVRHVFLCCDVSLDVGQVCTASTFAVIGMRACAQSQVGRALPIAAVVARVIAGQSEVRDFVVQEAGLVCGVQEVVVHLSGEFFVGFLD